MQMQMQSQMVETPSPLACNSFSCGTTQDRQDSASSAASGRFHWLAAEAIVGRCKLQAVLIWRNASSPLFRNQPLKSKYGKKGMERKRNQEVKRRQAADVSILGRL
jgi:hypothetical protein